MPEEPLGEHDATTVEPFNGTVTVYLSDAIVASSRKALVMREKGREPAFFVPFEDVYFEFLSETGQHESLPGRGIRRMWSGEAVGTPAAAVMWSYEEPEGTYVRVRDHGTFDPGKVKIEANPAEDREHTPHMP